MSRNVPFFLVDVFATEPLAGNPLALVPDADALDEATMKAIAREFNQSETTFIVRPTLPGATWRLRSFTPIGAEVLGAGHNAMGAWIWLANAGRLPQDVESFAQEIGEDVLPVQIRRSAGRTTVTMDQSPAWFGKIATDRTELAASLGLDQNDLVAGQDARVASTGADHLLVPILDRAGVDRAAPDPARLAAVLREVEGEGCYLYSLDPVDPSGGAVAYTRFFNPTVGIAEDPATGTAAGPLAATLAATGVIAQNSPVIIEQGFALGRPSRLQLTVSGDLVRLTGSGTITAEGSLHL